MLYRFNDAGGIEYIIIIIIIVVLRFYSMEIIIIMEIGFYLRLTKTWKSNAF